MSPLRTCNLCLREQESLEFSQSLNLGESSDLSESQEYEEIWRKYEEYNYEEILRKYFFKLSTYSSIIPSNFFIYPSYFLHRGKLGISWSPRNIKKYEENIMKDIYEEIWRNYEEICGKYEEWWRKYKLWRNMWKIWRNNIMSYFLHTSSYFRHISNIFLHNSVIFFHISFVFPSYFFISQNLYKGESTEFFQVPSTRGGKGNPKIPIYPWVKIFGGDLSKDVKHVEYEDHVSYLSSLAPSHQGISECDIIIEGEEWWCIRESWIFPRVRKPT